MELIWIVWVLLFLISWIWKISLIVKVLRNWYFLRTFFIRKLHFDQSDTQFTKWFKMIIGPAKKNIVLNKTLICNHMTSIKNCWNKLNPYPLRGRFIKSRNRHWCGSKHIDISLRSHQILVLLNERKLSSNTSDDLRQSYYSHTIYFTIQHSRTLRLFPIRHKIMKRRWIDFALLYNSCNSLYQTLWETFVTFLIVLWELLGKL